MGLIYMKTVLCQWLLSQQLVESICGRGRYVSWF